MTLFNFDMILDKAHKLHHVTVKVSWITNNNYYCMLAVFDTIQYLGLCTMLGKIVGCILFT